MKKALALMAGLLAVASFLSAQDWKGQGRLPGIVVDEQDNPIEGVHIKLFCPQWNGGFEVTTGSDGRFVAAWMRSGLWNIDFDKIGYQPVRKAFRMNQFERQPEMKVTMKKVEGLVITPDMKDDLVKANTLFDKQDYAGAVEAYRAMLEKFPEAYIIWRNIGNCYFVQEKYEEAEAAYKEVLAKNPDDVDSIVGVGNCYANRGDMDKAMEWYGKAPLDKISDSSSLYAIGIAYFKASKLEEAREYLDKAVEVEPTNTDALYQLGLTLTAMQKPDEAIAAFDKYLALDSDSERAGQVRGFLDYLRKK
jgi:tetratricopeptide (TPR) repeat protein